MATMLDLPREIYLIVCSDLSTKELSQLAAVSRDHYLAVQQPLFSHIRMTSYGSLVKLVSTLVKPPVVSRISPKQRQNWHNLSDSQLRERDIRHLSLLLDSEKDGHRITGVVLSRFISAITRKCDRVKISLTLLGLSDKLAKELDNFAMPNVKELTLYLGQQLESPDMGNNQFPRQRRGGSREDPLRRDLWSLSFGGTTFPDLRTFYMNDLIDRSENLPSNMESGFRMAATLRPRRGLGNMSDAELGGNVSFYGLANMQEIKLEYNSLLDATILKSLFGSTIIPKRLTRLEIVNCPSLHPIVDLEALATLLVRGLQLLQFLKLHLTLHFDGFDGYEWAYVSKINENPEHHLCNIVRKLGQNIKSLDLAVPFACNHIFVPLPKGMHSTNYSTGELPDVPEAPINTLPQRLMEAGYKYRRLIFNGFCREAHGWDEMASLAGSQEAKISWELLYDGTEDSKAMWFVSGYAPVEFNLQDAMQHPFDVL